MTVQVKEYWESRASESQGSISATTNDIYLRELEIATIIQTVNKLGMSKGKDILDLGCGDGYSTLNVAKAYPENQFWGLDYSEQMIDLAASNLDKNPELKKRIHFFKGDVLKLEDAITSQKFDLIITDRCLINLSSAEEQYQSIQKIANLLKPGGYYIAIENFVETHQNMNEARIGMGLPEISIRWHNFFFKEAEFKQQAEKNFAKVEFEDFASSYYWATRVIYSSMCKLRMEEPDYQHEIHQLAVKLPWVGKFSPVRMVICQKSA